MMKLVVSPSDIAKPVYWIPNRLERGNNNPCLARGVISIRIIIAWLISDYARIRF
jgi:hypothetical protein